MKKIFLLSVAITALLSSCKKDKDLDKAGIFKGPEVQVHGGKSWTWIQLTKAGVPEKLGVTITDAALNTLPVGGHDDGHDHDHGNMDNNWKLKFHPKASVTPFIYTGMDWNPSGHEPDQVYTTPHFDFHFYMSTPEEIAAIPPYQVDSSKFLQWPAADYLPAFYINPGGGVPQMGCHWVDVTSGEFNGQPFTQTFIYGTYANKVNFYEPMITLDFMKAQSNFERTIPQPAKVKQSGWYPTKMKLLKHDGVTEIILDAFVFRTQS
ncbi:MAG: hypothetical protein Q7T76_06775 [Ferruginibacter sp.]|nr:hypothetical protein [Ferruginibacter sp.]